MGKEIIIHNYKKEDDYGFVWEFGVHRDYRGNGYGKKLIKRAHKIMKDGLNSLEIRASSKVDDFKKIKDKYKLIEDAALKARLCIGYQYIS